MDNLITINNLNPDLDSSRKNNEVVLKKVFVAERYEMDETPHNKPLNDYNDVGLN